MAGADFGSGVDINAIGDIDNISENTSEELPNLGGESSESTKPADNTEQNV
jgi:hypothetical protein